MGMAPSCPAGDAGEIVDPVFIGIFRMDGLTGGEFESMAVDVDSLIDRALQVHFDAPFVFVVTGHMDEPGAVEGAAGARRQSARAAGR